MDKVQKIREEIEKRLKGERFLSSDKEYNYLLSFIDSLQEEPSIPEIVDEHYWEMLGEESVSEELEKAAIEAFKEIVDDERNSFLEIFKAGANWQKQQMMANAVEGAFIRRNRYTKQNVLNGLDVTCDAIQGFKDKDKIKVLFVKED